MPEIKPSGMYYRELKFDIKPDSETRTFTIPVSSDVPQPRKWGTEILDHSSGAIDLSRMQDGAPVLLDHDMSRQIGVVENASSDGKRLQTTIRFSRSALGQEIMQDVIDGIRKNVSIGYRIDEAVESSRGVFKATKWTPYEVSVTSVPVDNSVGFGRSDDDSFNPLDLLKQRSTAMSEPSENPVPAEETAPVIPAEPVAAPVNADEVAQRAMVMERNRIAAIQEFGTRANIDAAIIKRHIDSGTAADVATQEFIRMWSKHVDATATTSGRIETGTDEADKRISRATDALLARAGVLRGKEADEARQGNPYLHAKLFDMAKESAERSGFSTNGRDPLHVVRGAITTGTSDFPVILENTMHKTLLAAYTAAADTWSQFCSVGTVSDFRDWKRIYTGSISSLDTVNELGEFTNKSIPDGQAESIAVTTKGNLINISRQAIINDDLSYFVRLTQMLGRAAARSIERDVYALLAANPVMDDGFALFSTNHANYDSTGNAISISSLVDARIAMKSQMDISGNDYIGDIEPALLLCPISKGQLARETILSVYDPETSNKLQRRNDAYNIVSTIIDTPRLSGTGWYVFASPEAHPVIEVAFLNGNRTPYLETEQGFEVDGLRYKVRLDYGVGAVGYQGAFHNVGA
jgi:hypothetical protein